MNRVRKVFAKSQASSLLNASTYDH